MQSLKMALLAGVVAAAAFAGSAEAYPVTVSTGLTGGFGFTTTSSNPFTGPNTANATFTYTGPIAFSDTAPQNSTPAGDLNSAFGFSTANVSGYSGSGTVTSGVTPIANFSTLTSYLASSGSASNYSYGSWYRFDLGTLSAGTILTISHDDGVNVYQNGASVGGTNSGATPAITESVKLNGTGSTVLYYSRQNGSPSVLTVAVPEPMTLSLMGAGLVGLGMVRLRRRA